LKILAIKFKYLGDVAILETSLRLLHERFPEAEIHALVPELAAGILSPLPYITKVWGLPKKDKKGIFKIIRQLRKERFNYSFDFAGNDRGAWMSKVIAARKRVGMMTTLGFFGRKYMYNVRIKEGAYGAHEILRDLEVIKPYLKSLPKTTSRIELSCLPENIKWAEQKITRDSILCHLSTSMQKKDWPIEYWIELGRTLKDKGREVVFTSGPSEREQRLLETVAVALPQTQIIKDIPEIGQMMSLIKCAKVTVSGDTVISHLASGLNVHHLTLFGPSIIQQWEPRGEKSRWLWGGTCDCFGHPSECHREDHNMKRIQVDEVLKEIEYMYGL
jgi:ADP-heptose:LPS heptosyltransferase